MSQNIDSKNLDVIVIGAGQRAGKWHANWQNRVEKF